MGEDAAQVRMAVEAHSVQVPHFALEPIEAFVDRQAAGNRLAVGDGYLQPDALVVLQRIELVHHVEALATARIVDRPEIERHRERQIILQRAQGLDDALAPHDERGQVLSRLLLRADPRRDLRAARIHLLRIGGNVRLAIGRCGTGIGDGAVAGEGAHFRSS